MFHEEAAGLGALLAPHNLVLGTTQPQVGEVVEEEAEDGVAVLGVLARVEDVRVPHRVDVLGRDDRVVRVQHDQLEELTVQRDAPVRLLDGEAGLTRLRVDQLVRDRLEVELVDEAELVLHLGGGRGHGIPPR